MSRHPSRRTFLRETTFGAALLPSTLGGSQQAPPSLPPLGEGDSPDEAYWGLVRRQFAFSESAVPMNAANLCPSPRAVADEVTRLTRDIDVDCSFQNRARFSELIEQARARIARALNVDADEVALVRNTSEANNTINAGLPLEPGDEVVVWDQNHPTNNVAWDVRAARYGIRVRRVSVPTRPTSSQELLDPFLAALGERTRALAVSHVSNVSGLRLPVRELASATRERGIHLHVDGAQTLGADDLDLRALGCDSYASSSHKWLMGPKEAGVLYVRRDRIAEVWPAGVAPGWGADAESDLRGARKFESLGQRDDACLAALGATMVLHETIGAANVQARVTQLASALKEGAAEMGIPLVTPLEPELSGGVCILEVAGDRGAVFQRLYEEFGIAGAATGGLRLAPHVYNTMEHVERALAAIAAMRPQILGRP